MMHKTRSTPPDTLDQCQILLLWYWPRALGTHIHLGYGIPRARVVTAALGTLATMILRHDHGEVCHDHPRRPLAPGRRSGRRHPSRRAARLSPRPPLQRPPCPRLVPPRSPRDPHPLSLRYQAPPSSPVSAPTPIVASAPACPRDKHPSPCPRRTPRAPSVRCAAHAMDVSPPQRGTLMSTMHRRRRSDGRRKEARTPCAPQPFFTPPKSGPARLICAAARRARADHRPERAWADGIVIVIGGPARRAIARGWPSLVLEDRLC